MAENGQKEGPSGMKESGTGDYDGAEKERKGAINGEETYEAQVRKQIIDESINVGSFGLWMLAKMTERKYSKTN